LVDGKCQKLNLTRHEDKRYENGDKVILHGDKWYLFVDEWLIFAEISILPQHNW
jgi:hypothetical protein